MTTKEKIFFNSQGYYLARNLLPIKDIDDAIYSIRKTTLDVLSSEKIEFDAQSDLRNYFEKLMIYDLDKYKKLLSALWRKLEINQIMHHNNIVSFLHNIFSFGDIFLPGGQVVHVMSESLKIKNGYYGFSEHQDFPSVQGSLDGVIAWIPLVEINKDNYPLEIVPKSHKLGLIKNNLNMPGIKDNFFLDNDFISLDMKKGDVLFISVFTVHRSSLRGIRNNLRISISSRYCNGSENSFIKRVYPSAYSREVKREQIYKDFPSLDDLRNIFEDYE